MVNPGVVNETTTDNVLWRRHERPTDAIYIGFADMSFRAGSTAAIKNGPLSFPIIRDPSGSGGNLIGSGENTDAVIMCRRVWGIGDPLYFDQTNNGVIDTGTDTLLSTDTAAIGVVDLGHGGGALNAVPGDVRFVDLNADGDFDIGERIYRDENTDGVVDAGDTLLVGVLGTVVGNIDLADETATLLPLPSQVKYLDLIRQPANTFNIGYPAVQGVTAVSANDVEFTSIAFPVHGVAEPGIGGLGASMDDPSQYLPPGPDFTLFETQLVGHEFGHAFSLQHGDGIDDDGNGILDDADDPTAPVPGAGPGTLCDSNNVMSYCWLDSGTSANPNLAFIGLGAPTSGILTTAQADQVTSFVLTNVSDYIVDPITPSLISARVDTIGDVRKPFEHIDIAEFAVQVDASRSHTILSLSTRRPFPADTNRTVDFHFLLDIDGNPGTGGSPAAIEDNTVPTDFSGAEFVASVRIRGLEVESVTLFEYTLRTGEFVPIVDRRIRALRETSEAIPDFPFDLRDHDPDNFDRDKLLEFPSRENISVIVPNELITIPIGPNFSVEYISHEVESDVIDRARTSGMNFRVPVFPECQTEPGTVPQGGTTTVKASGLLPARDIHLLLGDTEVGTGQTDATGNVTLSMNIPPDAKVGERLVTLGALAVSADCSVTVVAQDHPTLGSQEFSLLKSHEDLLKGQQSLIDRLGLVLHELVANGQLSEEDALRLAEGYQRLIQQQSELIKRFEEIVREATH